MPVTQLQLSGTLPRKAEYEAEVRRLRTLCPGQHPAETGDEIIGEESRDVNTSAKKHEKKHVVWSDVFGVPEAGCKISASADSG